MLVSLRFPTRAEHTRRILAFHRFRFAAVGKTCKSAFLAKLNKWDGRYSRVVAQSSKFFFSIVSETHLGMTPWSWRPNRWSAAVCCCYITDISFSIVHYIIKFDCFWHTLWVLLSASLTRSTCLIECISDQVYLLYWVYLWPGLLAWLSASLTRSTCFIECISDQVYLLHWVHLSLTRSTCFIECISDQVCLPYDCISDQVYLLSSSASLTRSTCLIECISDQVYLPYWVHLWPGLLASFSASLTRSNCFIECISYQVYLLISDQVSRWNVCDWLEGWDPTVYRDRVLYSWTTVEWCAWQHSWRNHALPTTPPCATSKPRLRPVCWVCAIWEEEQSSTVW